MLDDLVDVEDLLVLVDGVQVVLANHDPHEGVTVAPEKNSKNLKFNYNCFHTLDPGSDPKFYPKSAAT